MRILVTGSRGQLGSKVVELLSREDRHQVTAADRGSVDVTQPAQIQAAVDALSPDWIVNCAAFTDVERAESEPEKAFLANDVALGHLADSALRSGARLLHVSTDYVFSGDFGGLTARPYTEEDAPAPLNRYGASKRAGEIRLEAHAAHSLVVRTSWLYGGPGKNFLHTMLRVAGEALGGGRAVRVVEDQVGTPTDVWSLAGQIRRLLDTRLRGIVHASSRGEASWWEFAREIFRLGRLDVAVEPIRTAEYPTKARRPPYSVLENHRLDAAGLDVLPEWREGLERAWKRLSAIR